MSIIKRFFFVVPCFTRHLYREYESVQITRGIGGSPSHSVTILRVVTIAMPISNPVEVDHIATDCEGVGVRGLVDKH
ncbi:hypothetical protein CC86DRAFT_297265 [Ophiobolus disseminans]|uniref:Uncharacterized protein n=1 Tax=Ophiobolus disseminans TaxID=1469910 RepID=A0A6A6ZTD1_9PLEO|nr:hypothetical protein CC86DRAFT_297265 [Ophiobolus disseminans]